MRPEKLPFLYRILRPYEKNRIKKVSELIDGDKLSVLEIGCSDGRFLYENRFRWKEITAVDIDKDKLEKARGMEFGVPIRFINRDFGIEKMPFATGMFDLVVSIATLQYIHHLDALFSDVFRILKKGGFFIFEVPNMAVFWRRWQFLQGRLPRTSSLSFGWDADVIHYFTCYDLKKFAIDNGFDIERISCSGILDGLRQYWVSLFGADIIFVLRK